MKYLIVTADDFGLTKSINEGIVKAYKEGIVTFLNLLPTGEAFEDTMELIKGLGVREVGAHLSLTETVPLTDPAKIPSLVAKDNRFYKDHNAFFLRLFLNNINREHIYIEFKSQLDALKKTGLSITNLSSHEHIHMVPQILNIFVELAKDYNIPSIRYPRENRPVGISDVNRVYRALILSYFNKGMNKILERERIAYTDHSLGFLDSGNLREDLLADTLASLEEGTTELVSHPGFLGPEVLDRYRFHRNCESELFALTSPRVKKIIKEKDIQLISYREFLARK